jgi:ComF family protein
MLKAFLDILFPPRCHFCKEIIPEADDLHLCARCLGACEVIRSPLCKRCGVPFYTDVGEDHLCGRCIDRTPPFTAARAAALFDGPIKELIHSLKYNRRVQHRRPLAQLAVRRLDLFVAESRADLVIPVPLHVKRLRQRGFNQAVLLGEIVAREWGLPLLRRNLRRIRWTEPQINLSLTERAANVRGAFSVSEPILIRDKRIILVDDVYTTGSTVSECSCVLTDAGASEVFVVTIARAIQ